MTRNKQNLKRKTHRFTPAQIAYMAAAPDVNWSAIMRAAADQAINQLTRETQSNDAD